MSQLMNFSIYTNVYMCICMRVCVYFNILKYLTESSIVSNKQNILDNRF
jgi:hypothetical protein